MAITRLGLYGGPQAAFSADPDTNVTASTDALVIVEQPVTIDSASGILASTGALVITEQTVDVTLVAGILATTDTIVTTGQSVSVMADVGMTAITAELVIAAIQSGIDSGIATAAPFSGNRHIAPFVS